MYIVETRKRNKKNKYFEVKKTEVKSKLSALALKVLSFGKARIYKVPTFTYDDYLGVEYRDCGQWRDYYLESWGETLDELIDNATIAEIDQDGGEITCYGIWGGPSEVERAAIKELEELTGKTYADYA